MKLSPRFAYAVSTMLLLSGVMLALAMPAHAAEYSTERFECRGSRGSGQTDSRGNFYIACEYLNGVIRPHIKIYDATGALKRVAELRFGDGASDYATDVAPSPDGAYLYVVRGRRPWRLNRQVDGSYAVDPAWKLATYPFAGAAYAALGEYIATDNNGFVYFSSGTWTNSPPTVVKYSPDGRFLTRFGQQVNNSWAAGDFYWMLAGIAVTPDGRSVYTTEVGNNRVQRFDVQLDGSYRAASSFGNSAADDNPATGNNEARDGICGRPGKFAAPYDVSLDSAGNLYVINTSCYYADGSFEVQKFTGAGQWLATIKPVSALGYKVHAIAVDARGNVYLAQANTVLRPPAQPAGDATAPAIRAVGVPATSERQTITVTIDATDNVGVTQMRLANENEDITARPWQVFSSPVQQTLSAGFGDKTVKVQVRDAAGNTSLATIARTTYSAPVVVPVDATAPTITNAAVVATTQNQTVAVTLTATDNVAATQMRLANETEGIAAKAWIALASPVQHTLSAGAGNKVISVQVRDAAGNVSQVRTLATTYAPPAGADLAAPVINSVTLPNPTYVQTIMVATDASDDRGVTQMRLASESGIWQPWQAFSAQRQFTLSPNFGFKGAFVQVRDAAGKESNIVYRTSSYLASPVGAPVPPPEPAPVPGDVSAPVIDGVTLPTMPTTKKIAVAVNASDDRGVTQMRLANENGIWQAWKAFANPTQHTLSAGAGLKGVFVQVRDAAGKQSNIVYARTRLDVAVGMAQIVALRMVGTLRIDRIRGTRHNDLIRIDQYDRKRDVVDCGPGRDVVIKRPEDRTRNCERVIITRAPYG